MSANDPDDTRFMSSADFFPGDDEATVPHFPIAVRGYDRSAVDAWVEKVSTQLRAPSDPSAAVREAIDRVGRETSDVLQRAHETAERLVAEAQAEAARLRSDAERDAVSIRADAEQAVKGLDRDADLIWQERGKLLLDVRRLASELELVVAHADERFPPEAATPAPTPTTVEGVPVDPAPAVEEDDGAGDGATTEIPAQGGAGG